MATPRKLSLPVVLIVTMWLGAAASGQDSHEEGFEEGLGDFTVSSWRAVSPGGLTEAAFHGGGRCVELTGGAGAGDVTVLWWNNPGIKLLAGERYTVSVWVKTQDVAGVELRIAVPDGVEISGLKTDRLTGTNDWKKLQQSFTVSAAVQPKHIAVWMTGPGKVWADDFRLQGKTVPTWRKEVEIDPAGVRTEKDFMALLKRSGLETTGYANYFTGRWPNISFIGGMVMGNRSEDLEFFYSKPFKWWTEVLDYVMQDGGDVYGIRARIHRYKEKGNVAPVRSFLLTIRTDTLLRDYHPSYIYANGRRIWDAKKHPLLNGKICAPFSVEEGVDPVIDMVVDRKYTPKVKGLAFRMFFVQYLGEPGVKVDLKGASDEATGSPADKLEKFQFGLFPSGYDFWTTEGPTFAEIKKAWKPNFRPDYPVDEVYLAPVLFRAPGRGKYHDFMVTYGGGNVLGNKPDAALARKNASYLRAVLCSPSAADAKAIFELGPGFQAHRFSEGSAPGKEAVAAAKRATGQPERVKVIFEPFPPALSRAQQYERGCDILVLKNEEDPQYNIMMSMGRGAGRTAGKPFGFYWEQTHYPYPSLDEKLHTCMLYYLSGGSYIGGEAEAAHAFGEDIVADWVVPFVKALRFAMVHPARGKPVVPVGILWGQGDAWWIPYNVFGEMDTFQRHIEYDHATRSLKCEPAVTRVFPWMPQDRRVWRWPNTGHLAMFIDHVDELKGYDLLDVFFPKYGDAFTARITRLLTGTPYGPVDFVYGDKASAEHLASFGMIAVLGHAGLNGKLEAKLTHAAEAGAPVLVGAQHFKIGRRWVKAFGLTILPRQSASVDGPVTGDAALYEGKTGQFSGKVYGFNGDGWETVASVGEKPLVVRKTVGKAPVYVYLGEWMHQGGDALRPILAAMGEQAAPLRFAPADDQMEYVAYRKGAGAWVALFNHGGIPIGCDRLKKLRAIPPEPLVSKVKGPYKGRIEFRLARLGLDPKADYSLYEVEGIDGRAFEQVISGHKTFTVRRIDDSQQKDGVITATVGFAKRGQYVIAPTGRGREVFFGKP